ncbi:MAG: hypothetical protein GEV06_12820 [Luteitalea sp.]|nr:hypothetical protein [Luteitalea sp.]
MIAITTSSSIKVKPCWQRRTRREARSATANGCDALSVVMIPPITRESSAVSALLSTTTKRQKPNSSAPARSVGSSCRAVATFFEIVDDPAHHPVFVHCRRGADRTGTFVGLYRIARQGWDGDEAYDEAREVGMRWWYFRVKGYLEDFGEDWEDTRAAAPLPRGGAFAERALP